MHALRYHHITSHPTVSNGHVRSLVRAAEERREDDHQVHHVCVVGRGRRQVVQIGEQHSDLWVEEEEEQEDEVGLE